MKLGFNIKLIRNKWRFKQSQVGYLLGVPSTQVGKYESGANHPRLPALLKLVEMTGLNVYNLCTRDIDMSEIPDQPLMGYKPDQMNDISVKYEHGSEKDKRLKLQEKLLQVMEKNIGLQELVRELEKEVELLKTK